MKDLKTILRDLREDHDLRQETIASYLGVSQQTYSNYENGHREIPVTVVKKLAQYYHVSTDYLLGSDTSYLGSINLNASYIGDITMHDVMYDIQNLDNNNRKDLIRYIQFLHHDFSDDKRKM